MSRFMGGNQWKRKYATSRSGCKCIEEGRKAKVDIQGELNNVETKKTHKIEDIANQMWNAIIVAREVITLETASTEESSEML